ncbi:MAG: hypothetical protein LKM30_00925 [Bacilli bacterium]|jgi:hypothetical protein|nr:hypothetical protein [Bacilli bacterium]
MDITILASETSTTADVSLSPVDIWVIVLTCLAVLGIMAFLAIRKQHGKKSITSECSCGISGKSLMAAYRKAKAKEAKKAKEAPEDSCSCPHCQQPTASNNTPRRH